MSSALPVVHGSSNPVVLQAPVVQQIRAASCRAGHSVLIAGSTGGGVQTGLLGGGTLTRNEPHPLARLAVTTNHYNYDNSCDNDDCNDNGLTRFTSEASVTLQYRLLSS